MSTITFDTLKYANTLKAGGVPPAQAEAEAVALSGVLEVNFKELVTKQDLELALTPMRGDLSVVQSDIRTLKTDVKTIQGDLHLIAKHLAVLNWGIGLLVAMAVSVTVKTFWG